MSRRGEGVPPTVRAFLAGQSGSGKTTRAESLYLRHFPRRILCDLTGEHEAGADAVAYDAAGLWAAFRALAPRGRWSVRLIVDPAEFAPIVDYLVPVPDLTRSPIRALGGAVILVDEIDLLAPPRSASTEVRTFYRRSRHCGLSIVSTTQRPANVSREVSAQSSHAVALALSEPRDVDYMAELMRWTPEQAAGWRRWTRQHPHGGCWKDLQGGRLLWLPEAGAPTDQGPRGAQVEAFEPEPAGADVPGSAPAGPSPAPRGAPS